MLRYVMNKVNQELHQHYVLPNIGEWINPETRYTKLELEIMHWKFGFD